MDLRTRIDVGWVAQKLGELEALLDEAEAPDIKMATVLGKASGSAVALRRVLERVVGEAQVYAPDDELVLEDSMFKRGWQEENIITKEKG